MWSEMIFTLTLGGSFTVCVLVQLEVGGKFMT